MAVLFADISLRKREERLRTALFNLTDRLAEQKKDVAALTDVACGILGRTLGVQLVGYGLVNPVAETITVDHDWTTDGAQSLAGMLQFRDFGSYIDDLKRGETVVVEDARTDPRTETFAAALESAARGAFVNTPIFERGQFVALQYVSTGEPRIWMEENSGSSARWGFARGRQPQGGRRKWLCRPARRVSATSCSRCPASSAS